MTQKKEETSFFCFFCNKSYTTFSVNRAVLEIQNFSSIMNFITILRNLMSSKCHSMGDEGLQLKLLDLYLNSCPKSKKEDYPVPSVTND